MYQNIIYYAIHLSKQINESNIIKFYDKIASIIASNINKIFNEILLKGVNEYFTKLSSPYVIGLNALNKVLIDTDISYLSVAKMGGSKDILVNKTTERQQVPVMFQKLTIKQLLKSKPLLKIDEYINKLDTTPMFKLNSFGLEFIGFGLNEHIKIIYYIHFHHLL